MASLWCTATSVALLTAVSAAQGGHVDESGRYFARKRYVPQPLPRFAEMVTKLPKPIFDEEPGFVRCYWKAWELAFAHFRQPQPASPFVSNYIDEGFNSSLFLWDTLPHIL